VSALVWWFLLGVAAGMNIAGLVYHIILTRVRRRYDSYVEAHKVRLAEFEAVTNQRHASLRKRLGLPPREHEWS